MKYFLSARESLFSVKQTKYQVKSSRLSHVGVRESLGNFAAEIETLFHVIARVCTDL